MNLFPVISKVRAAMFLPEKSLQVTTRITAPCLINRIKEDTALQNLNNEEVPRAGVCRDYHYSEKKIDM